MKKSNIIIFAVLLALVGLVLIIHFTRKVPEQRDRVLRDFTVNDTASVDKIFLADKRGRQVELNRENGYWTVNNEYVARRDFVNLLLSTFRRMEVSAPVPQAKLDYVLRGISANGIKCEIYQNGRIYKTYYVGGVTPDNTGTYMIMENSDRPFVVRIPGFSGYLSVRYNTSVEEWRERIVYNYDLQDVHRITVKYPDNLSESFTAVHYGNNQYDLQTIDNESVDFEFDTIQLKKFIAQARVIGLEAFVAESRKPILLDSLNNEPVMRKFIIENFDGKKEIMEAYYRQNIDQVYDDEGILYDYDLDRLFAVFNNRKELALVQYYTIDPISLKLTDFRRY